jgi:NADPH:quinone reductase-like Zn-dependent oxidoreductase
MRALLATDGADPLVKCVEVPEPAPARDEAVIAVEAFSINRGETFLLEQPRVGWRPGKDIAGRVVRAASDGTGPRAGARVVGHPGQGGWAELAAVPTAALAALPVEIDSETAAALPLAGLTALRLLRAAGPLAGCRVLLTGASGGVGHFVSEVAGSVGAEVTAVSASPERAERLRALGAAHVVHDVEHAEPPFDVALESGGGRSLARAFGLLARGGRLIWFGQASRKPSELDFFSHFAQTGAIIRHFHYEDSAIPLSRDLATLVRLVATGRLHPELGLVADWSESAAAVRDLRDRRLRGKAGLRIGRPAARSSIPTRGVRS